MPSCHWKYWIKSRDNHCCTLATGTGTPYWRSQARHILQNMQINFTLPRNHFCIFFNGELQLQLHFVGFAHLHREILCEIQTISTSRYGINFQAVRYCRRLLRCHTTRYALSGYHVVNWLYNHSCAAWTAEITMLKLMQGRWFQPKKAFLHGRIVVKETWWDAWEKLYEMQKYEWWISGPGYCLSYGRHEIYWVYSISRYYQCIPTQVIIYSPIITLLMLPSPGCRGLSSNIFEKDKYVQIFFMNYPMDSFSPFMMSLSNTLWLIKKTGFLLAGNHLPVFLGWSISSVHY